MIALGTRTIDELGRIVLPQKLRQSKDWTTGSKVTLYDFHGIVVVETCTHEQEPDTFNDLDAPQLFNN